MTALKSSTMLITGAASGIGRATALAAAQAGARLVLTDIQDEALATVVDEIEGQGGTVLTSRALDISDAEAVIAWANEVHAAHGAVQVVANVAGISTWGRVQDLQLEHWRAQVEVNLMGPIHVIHAFVPTMIAAGRGGHIVNVASAAGLFGLPLHAPYSAAKFGLRGISEVLRFDLESQGVKVTLVCPGAVATPLVNTVNIVGVDRERPDVQALTARFQRHAVSPEAVAQQILRGITRNRSLVMTSWDIRAGYRLQRWAPWAYRAIMRGLNRQVTALLD